MAYILVADDDDVLAEIVRQRLTAVGHEVTAVEDGEQLLEQVRYRMPDAILLDAMMPVRSGIETLIALKSDPVHSEIPIIMMTARRNQADVLAALKAGASDYVTKPFSPEDLALRIEGLLARRHYAAEGCGMGKVFH
ncbi:response regulator [Croceicoccus ponticola]|uniref:Response regulator n=1 Tax=Croceicoccus ponticola TaxID=2217664 RepID=A0A437H179_9SPHN|nr:response regulator [Croceicoccus ponticola]RVQ69385.1 response regulator [Croceicoccus ponticola]